MESFGLLNKVACEMASHGACAEEMGVATSSWDSCANMYVSSSKQASGVQTPPPSPRKAPAETEGEELLSSSLRPEAKGNYGLLFRRLSGFTPQDLIP